MATSRRAIPPDAPPLHLHGTDVSGHAPTLQRFVENAVDLVAAAGPDEPPFLPGQRVLGNYTIQHQLGRGGMGAVYLAVADVSGQKVAVKVLPASLARARDLRERFVHEARALASLDHPNIVPLVTFAQEGEDLLLVMKYVPGESLDARIRAGGTLSAENARRILRAVLTALGYAHARGVVHRDVKPANVLLDASSGEERVTLVDFGISKNQESASLTQTGMLMGTPQYMSPEQINGMPVDGRSDLYACGLLLFEMLTGRPPFDGTKTFEVLRAHIDEPVPDVAQARGGPVPDELVQLVHVLLAKDPGLRPKDAATVLAYLDGAGALPAATSTTMEVPRATPATATHRPPAPRPMDLLSQPIHDGVVGGANDDLDDEEIARAIRRPGLRAFSLIVAVTIAFGAGYTALRRGLVDDALRSAGLRTPAFLDHKEKGTTAATSAASYDEAMAKALASFAAGDDDAAIVALRSALVARPGAAEAQSLLVDALLSSGDAEQAGATLAAMRGDADLPEVVRERFLEQQTTLARMKTTGRDATQPQPKAQKRIPVPLIYAVTARTNAEMQSCYERLVLAKDKTAHGPVRITATIAPDGAVQSAALPEGALGDATFHECLLAAARTWRFPPWRGASDSFTITPDFHPARR